MDEEVDVCAYDRLHALSRKREQLHLLTYLLTRKKSDEFATMTS